MSSFSALFSSIKQSGRLLEGLRHAPVDAVDAVHAHATTAERHTESQHTMLVRVNTRRPEATARTEIVKPTVAVVSAQRREEEILANLAIFWLARFRRNAARSPVISTHIKTLVVHVL